MAVKDHWLEGISVALNHDDAPEVVEEGFFTIQELASKLGLHRSTVNQKVLTAVKDGKIERKNFRVTSGGKRQVIPHYRYLCPKRKSK